MVRDSELSPLGSPEIAAVACGHWPVSYVSAITGRMAARVSHHKPYGCPCSPSQSVWLPMSATTSRPCPPSQAVWLPLSANISCMAARVRHHRPYGCPCPPPQVPRVRHHKPYGCPCPPSQAVWLPVSSIMVLACVLRVLHHRPYGCPCPPSQAVWLPVSSITGRMAAHVRHHGIGL